VTPLSAKDAEDDEIEDSQDTEDSAEETESSEDEDFENDTTEAAPEFVADQCLFCGQQNGTFEASLAHMQKTHSFMIPYQSLLSVDVQTLVWYLHLVIYGYHECLLCSKRRSSLEAVQQHMVAKGHCRFDLSDDYADFYNLEALEKNSNDGLRLDESSLRLPSGKVLTSRADAHNTNSRPSNSSDTQQHNRIPASHEKGSSSELISRQDRKLGAYAMQLSQLSSQDQRSLVHLSFAEQRSVLATRKKQLDKAQREERRARSKVERLGNRTLMRHFKNDVPGRSNG
jgi:pre-60S factor REI1